MITKILKLFGLNRSIYFSNLIIYLKNIIRGKDWTEFYENLMDETVKNDKDVFGDPEEKRFHLEYMITKGLLPESRFLDYGCGSGVSGKSFIEYLNKDKYTGVDISNEAIKTARDRIKDNNNLNLKNPNFKYIKKADMEILQGNEFDYIFANSVFTHMPLEDINFMLNQLKIYIHKDSVYYATICRTEGKSRMVQFRTWMHSVDEVKRVAEENGYECNVHSDWSHPSDPEGTGKERYNDTMLSFQLKN